MATIRPADEATTCRRCPVRCDTVVYLSGCIRSSCPRLYAYEREGRTVVGCLERVFGVEIDLETFHAMQATRVGFGALRAIRPPLPVCHRDVDRAFTHRAPGACVNPGFLLASDDGIRVDVDR